MDEGNTERRRQAQMYMDGIHNSKITIPAVYENVYHVYHLFPILVEERDAFREYLSQNGIKTQVHYPIPPYVAECYKDWGYAWSDFPNAERNAKQEISLPIYAGLTNEEVQYVIDVINQY